MPQEVSAEAREDLSALREGCGAAWEAFFSRLERRCLALAWRILDDPELAADAVQEAFLKAFQSRASMGAETKLQSWILATVANASRDVARRHSRERRLLESLEQRAPPAQRAEGRKTSPEEEMEATLRSALGRLDEMARVTFLLVHQEGWNYQEVAQAMGWPVGTVSSKLHRARASLRSMLSRGGKRA